MKKSLILTTLSLVAGLSTSCSTAGYNQPGTTATTQAGAGNYSVPTTQQSVGVTPSPYPTNVTQQVASQAPAATTTNTAPVATTSSATRSHNIVKGDTLFGITRKYNVTLDALKKANGMTGDTIYAGQTLRIP